MAVNPLLQPSPTPSPTLPAGSSSMADPLADAANRAKSVGQGSTNQASDPLLQAALSAGARTPADHSFSVPSVIPSNDPLLAAAVKATGKTPPVTSPASDPYFYKQFPSGATMGKTDTLDKSGRPFLGYRNPGDTSTTTDTTRVASTFDPTKAQPLTKDQYYNPRAEGLRQALHEKLGMTASDQLDHAIALTVGGSNDPSNLRSISTSENQAAGNFEGKLAQDLRDGKISYLDAQISDAEHKGIKAPWVPPEFRTDNQSPWDHFKAYISSVVTPQDPGQLDTKTMADQAIKNLLGGKDTGSVTPAGPTDLQKAESVPGLGNIVKAGANVVDTIKSTIDDTAKRVTDFIYTSKDATPAERTGKGLSAGLGIANLFYMPFPAALGVIRAMPLGGKEIAGAVDYLFNKVGEGSAYEANHVLDALPFSSTTKESLRGPITELSTLINATLLGGKVHESIPLIKEKAADLKDQVIQVYKETNPQAGFIKNPLPDQFGGFKDITSKILDDLEGKTIVTKQYISDLSKKPELTDAERQATQKLLNEYPDGKIPVKEFADKMRTELLPLSVASPENSYRYENVRLPDEQRGNVASYYENIYNSPVKTSAGHVHFSDATDSYFGHTRVEDMADSHEAVNSAVEKSDFSKESLDMQEKSDPNMPDTSGTRRVIEVQSDLFQKGNLDRENAAKKIAIKRALTPEEKTTLTEKANNAMDLTHFYQDISAETFKKLRVGLNDKDLFDFARNGFKEDSGFTKLEPYRNTWQDRIIKEEVKQAATDGKTKLQFPTGETAMKIEQLSRADAFRGMDESGALHDPITPQGLRVGRLVGDTSGHPWVITEVLENGQFKAVPKRMYDDAHATGGGGMDRVMNSARGQTLRDLQETFDISGKVDTNNPIYKFYEKEVGRYLQKNYDAKLVTDDKGVKWWEVDVKKDMADQPVSAFGSPTKNPVVERTITEKLKGQPITIRSKGDFADEQRANKEYVKVSKKLAEENLPNKDILSIRRKESQVKDIYGKNKDKAEEALAHILTSFELAKPGERVPIMQDGYQTGTQGVKSTYPDWLPSHLRNRDYLDKVLETTKDLNSLTYPNRINAHRQAEVINHVYNQIDHELGVNTESTRSDILNKYQPETRIATKDERAAASVADKTARETERLTAERDKLKAREERIKQKAEEGQKKVVAEELQRTTLQQKIKKAQIEETKRFSFLGRIKQALFPIKALDLKTQEIIDKWYQEKAQATTKAQDTYNQMKLKGPQNFKEVTEYQAGKQTPYIREALDSLGTEAKRNDLDFDYRENYLPQVYRQKGIDIMAAIKRRLKDQGMSPEEIEGYLSGTELTKDQSLRLKLNPNFIKERFFPDYKTAIKYGLTPKFETPAQLIAYYHESLLKAIANKNFIEKLKTEARLLGEDDKPDSWEPVTTRFSREQLYAQPELATFLNGIYRNEEGLNATQIFLKGLGNLSAAAWDLTTSTGVPFTTFNSFGAGVGFLKPLTAALGKIPEGLIKVVGKGDASDIRQSITAFKQSLQFFTSNMPGYTRSFMENHVGDIANMAKEKIALPRDRTNYTRVSEGFKKIFSDAKGDIIASAPLFQEAKMKGVKKVSSAVSTALRLSWSKTFSERTYEMMGSQTVLLFSDTFREAKRHGMSDIKARKIAAGVTRSFMGITDISNSGRSKDVLDGIRAVIGAPKYREGIVGVLFNSLKSVTTDFKNPAFSLNRGLLLGAAMTYILYNIVNKKTTGHYMWDNPSGREFALGFPLKDGNVAYTDILPSVLTLPRNLAEGSLALIHGDIKTASQKAGTFFSMPVQAVTNIFTNKDYFGRPIWDDADTLMSKAKKAGVYATGQLAGNAYITEPYKYFSGQEPAYEAIARMLEAPVKFSSALTEQWNKVQHIYDDNQKLKANGETAKANDVYVSLSKEEKKTYDLIKADAQRVATIRRKPAIQKIYDTNQKLKTAGNKAEADRIYYSLSQSDQKIYDSIKKKANK